MAINISTNSAYTGRHTAPDANYTYGSAKNETSTGAGDGTPYELARANDVFGFQQALLRAASIVPNTNAETQLISQYMQAIVELASGRAYHYDESGVVNAYELDVRANQQGPQSYFDGLLSVFTPSITNTGASTADVALLGPKNIFYNGAALIGGELVAGVQSKIKYDLANDRHNLVEVPPKINGYALNITSYDDVSFDATAQDTAPDGMFFKDDGTKIYIVGNTNDTIYQYSLPSPWVLTGATYDSISFSVASETTNPTGVFFKSDGTKIYVLGAGIAYQYSLPTPWVLTGATYDTVSFSFLTQDTAPRDIFFKDNGSKVYMVGDTNNTIFQYSLPTPWVLTGATYDSISFSVASEETNPQGIFFKPDGKKLFMVGSNFDKVHQYSLPTPWVLTGAAYNDISFSVTEASFPFRIFFKSDGTKMYINGVSNNKVYQYSCNFLSI